MNKKVMKRAVVIAIAGAVALGAVTTASAAPVLSSTTAVNNAVPSSVIDVRYYRGRHYGHYRHYYGPAAGLGALATVGAVAGAAAYGNGYYGNRGYYGQGYYGGGPYYGGGGPYYRY